MWCSDYIIHQSFDFVNGFVRFGQVIAHCVIACFGKVVEKSGNVWYNGFIRAVNLLDKSEFVEAMKCGFMIMLQGKNSKRKRI